MLVRDVFPVVGREVCSCILLRIVSIAVFKIVCVFVYLVLLILTVEAQRTWKLFPECLNNKIYKEIWHSPILVSLFSCSLVFKLFTILGEKEWNWVCGKPFVLGVSVNISFLNDFKLIRLSSRVHQIVASYSSISPVIDINNKIYSSSPIKLHFPCKL